MTQLQVKVIHVYTRTEREPLLLRLLEKQKLFKKINAAHIKKLNYHSNTEAITYYAMKPTRVSSFH